jgi:hypothetical protein
LLLRQSMNSGVGFCCAIVGSVASWWALGHLKPGLNLLSLAGDSAPDALIQQ